MLESKTETSDSNTPATDPKPLSKMPLYTKPLSKPVTIESPIFTIFDSCIPGGMLIEPSKHKVQ